MVTGKLVPTSFLWWRSISVWGGGSRVPSVLAGVVELEPMCWLSPGINQMSATWWFLQRAPTLGILQVLKKDLSSQDFGRLQKVSNVSLQSLISNSSASDAMRFHRIQPQITPGYVFSFFLLGDCASRVSWDFFNTVPWPFNKRIELTRSLAEAEPPVVVRLGQSFLGNGQPKNTTTKQNNLLWIKPITEIITTNNNKTKQHTDKTKNTATQQAA